MSISRRIANKMRGHLSQRRGEAFENLLRGECRRTKWTVVFFPPGIKNISTTRFIRVKTPLDFIFVKGPKVVFIDAKTTKAKTYSFSKLTPHQIEMLIEIENHGHEAGYCVNFTELNITVFFRASMLVALKGRTSLKPDDGIVLGSNSIIVLDRLFIDKPQQATM